MIRSYCRALLLTICTCCCRRCRLCITGLVAAPSRPYAVRLREGCRGQCVAMHTTAAPFITACLYYLTFLQVPEPPELNV